MDGRHDEFREYVTARGAALLRTAYLLCGNRADAEDLLQTALAKTYLGWHRIQDRGALDGYVRRAMVNTQISWWRRRKVDVYATDVLPDLPVDDPTEASAVHDALWMALRRLSKRQRAAVVLRYYEDLSEAEIANVLSVSTGTVKSTISRALGKLRSDVDLRDDIGTQGEPPASGEPSVSGEASIPGEAAAPGRPEASSETPP